jgi:uncharacterized membrane protein YhaH (DUF805 family)
MSSTKTRDRLARATGRADRIKFIKIVWPIVALWWAGVAVFDAVYPQGAGDTPTLTGLAVLAAAAGVVLWAAVLRVHDLDRSGWWLLVLTIFGRMLQLGLIATGGDPAGPGVLLATILMALIYLSFAPGTPGPNRFGAEPARWVGPPIATPAVSLMTPAAGTADFEGDLLEEAADAYDVRSVIHFADLTGGSQIIIDRTGEVFATQRRRRGWQVDYLAQRVPTPDFNDLKARMLKGYEGRLEWSEEVGPQLQEEIDAAQLKLEAMRRAENLAELSTAIVNA